MKMDELVKSMNGYADDIVKYSDEMRETAKKINALLSPIFSSAGVRFTDDAPFYKEEIANGKFIEYFLTITTLTGEGSGIGVRSSENGEVQVKWLTDVSNVELRSALPKLESFLMKYNKKLERVYDDYKYISEQSEVLLNDLSSY